MGNAMTCKKCGASNWVQYELRKKGIVILGGVPCLSTHSIVQPVKFLKCQKCGEVLTDADCDSIIAEASCGKNCRS